MLIQGNKILLCPPKCGSTSLTTALCAQGWTFCLESWKINLCRLDSGLDVRVVIRNPISRVRSMYRHHVQYGFAGSWKEFVLGLGHDPFQRPCSTYGDKFVKLENIEDELFEWLGIRVPVPRLNVSFVDPEMIGMDEVIIGLYREDYREYETLIA